MLSSTITTAISALAIFANTASGFPTIDIRTLTSRYDRGDSIRKLEKHFPQSSLPPPKDLELKYVLLGVGTQNYTCTANATDVPGTTGAVANLYDIGTSLSHSRCASSDLSTLSGLALSFFTSSPSQLTTYLHQHTYNQIGHHFFAPYRGTNTPTFSLDLLDMPAPKPVAYVAKLNATDAPQGAPKGKDGLAAIQWLLLADVGGSVGGVSKVYRVATAGGNRPTSCKGMEQKWEVEYAAQYWLYGPKTERSRNRHRDHDDDVE